MTHNLNSSNNESLLKMHYSLTIIKSELETAYKATMEMTEQEYPEVYSLRGIFNNLQAIISEVNKGIQGGYVSTGYLSEKSDRLVRDLEGLANAHYDNVSTHFSSKIVDSKQ